MSCAWHDGRYFQLNINQMHFCGLRRLPLALSMSCHSMRLCWAVVCMVWSWSWCPLFDIHVLLRKAAMPWHMALVWLGVARVKSVVCDWYALIMLSS